MNYYEMGLVDEPKSSWVIKHVVKKLPAHPHREGVPAVFYRFFPFPDAQVQIKPQYQHLCCKKCGRFDSDKVFDVGFGDPVTIRLKGELGHTDDRMFIINNHVLGVLHRAKVQGFETKPLGTSGWHAVRVTLRVRSADGIIKNRKPNCSTCGRPRESYGSYDYCSEIDVPKRDNTFFTHKRAWPSSHFRDRDVFATEDVVIALKAAKVKGPYFNRLLSDIEREHQKQKEKQGNSNWWPPKTTIYLSGK
jgi:hypothetical protein